MEMMIWIVSLWTSLTTQPNSPTSGEKPLLSTKITPCSPHLSLRPSNGTFAPSISPLFNKVPISDNACRREPIKHDEPDPERANATCWAKARVSLGGRQKTHPLVPLAENTGSPFFIPLLAALSDDQLSASFLLPPLFQDVFPPPPLCRGLCPVFTSSRSPVRCQAITTFLNPFRMRPPSLVSSFDPWDKVLSSVVLGSKVR